MKIDFLQEPALEFGVDSHIDIRFGLMNYGPVDYASSLAKEIKLGVVGTNETVEGLAAWLEKCREEIPAKESNQPNLFPKFPGFRSDIGFQSSLSIDSRLQRTISQQLFNDLKKQKSINQAIQDAVDLFYVELEYLAEKTAPDVLVCSIPLSLLELTTTSHATTPSGKNEVNDDTQVNILKELEGEDHARLNFHHLLKAKAMGLKIPLQLIIPSTYDETKRPRRKHNPKEVKRLQDEATRAWNLHTAFYYKAKGVPWRLPRSSEDFSTCYVGVSFYETLDRVALSTSVAQIFNERGEGVVVRGGQAKISKDDRKPHLERDDAYTLLQDALIRYRQEHKNFPARVVIHKSSSHTNDEIDGFQAAARDQQVEMLDLLSLSQTETRLFRAGEYPPLRGTLLSLNSQEHVLYTRGSVDFFATYPGMYVPKPLLFKCDSTEQTAKFLAQEILGLTKMNWNNTQFDGGDPITMHAAHQVSNILKYVEKDGYVAPSYRFYM